MVIYYYIIKENKDKRTRHFIYALKTVNDLRFVLSSRKVIGILIFYGKRKEKKKRKSYFLSYALPFLLALTLLIDLKLLKAFSLASNSL